MARLHKCDVCSTEYEHHTPTIDFDPDARANGGTMHYRDGESFEWPYKPERLDLCSECCKAVAATLQERMSD